MKIAIPAETFAGERRVAATPQSVRRLIKLGFEVDVEAGAGKHADFLDGAYSAAGARIVSDTRALYAEADLVLKVRPLGQHPTLGLHEAELLREGAVYVSFLWPAQSPELLERLRVRRVSAIAMDAIPRITRAQKMDALSSMANIAGYRAVVEAASHFGRFFAGQMTAAGKVPPAKVLIIGAGVAGLSAIGAARGLGAIVRAFDTRPAAKEQVESMGAELLELDFKEDGSGDGGYAKEMSPAFIEAEHNLFASQAKELDIIITTALIPGKKAPLLLPARVVENMKPGSVIVDMAAEQGGNCELTKPGEVAVVHGVTIVGVTDLPSRMAAQSSELYASNLCHLLEEMGGGAGFEIDLEDEVVRGALVTHAGEVTWPPPKPRPAVEPREHGPTKSSPSKAPPAILADKAKKRQTGPTIVAAAFGLAATAALAGLGLFAPVDFLAHFTVFVLACFVGWQVVWNVSPALHTPLMSVTNAISGIIIVGGMLHQTAGSTISVATWLGALAILLATINIAGGFLVTQRMLRMFRK